MRRLLNESDLSDCRGEATPLSDVILDEVSASDITACPKMLDHFSHRKSICGFLM